MNCNCNNINNTDGSGLTAYISHVYGNVLRLAIPLTLRTVTMENGEMVATDTDFIPSSDYPVTVVFSKGGVKISLEATMQNGNIAYIEDLGTIPVGKYDIAVLCKDDNGNPYRFKQVTALHIVDATADANIPSDIEYEVTTWYLDAAIFLALKGEDGVGIDDIITESSGEIGGMNTVTIVLTNGETRTFTVMNGSGQVDSDFNINSPHPLSNSTITAKFNAIDSSIDGLFGGADYDSQSKTIRFYNKDRSRVLATLDARPFIKDGMVNSVYISNNTLVITFNTDAGREAIGVSLSSIFNPNNYYTKTQVNNLLGNYYNKDVIDNLVRNNASLLDDGRLGNLQSSPIVLDGMYWDNDEWPDGAAGNYYKVYHTVSRDKHEIVLYKWINDGTAIRQVRVYRDVDPTAIYYDKDSETFYRYDMVEDDFIEIETGSGSSGYEPPVGGIPKSDLSQSVQASLSKADTALQSQEQADWNESDSSDPAYIKNKPTIPDVSGFVTASDVADAVADLVDSAPATLDTLKELADALGDDPNFATTMTTALGNKVDKETGKSLMTDSERTKLQGIAAGAEVNVQPNWTQTNTSSDDYIKNKPTLATVATSGSYNDLQDKPTIPVAYDDTTLSGRVSALENAGFITTETDPTVPSWAKADTKPTYTAQEVGALPASTTIPTKTSDLTNDSGFIDKVLYYGTCATAASTMPKVCTVETFPTYTDNGVTHAKEGAIIAVKFTNSDTNTTDAPELNVNGIGAKAIMYNNAIVTSTAKNTTVAGYTKQIAYYRYDPELDEGNGAWEYLGKSVDSNSTYSPVSLGFGYASQSNASASATITATLSSYSLTTNGIVSVKFTYDVPASATLNINSKGAKAIYNQGTAITAGVIKAGDTATFIYSTYYHLIAVDSWQEKQDAIDDLATIRSGAAAGATAVQSSDLATVATTGAYSDLSGKPSLATVATSGSYNDLSNKPTLFSGNYNDLTNKPTIPAAQVNADWNASSGVTEILNKPTIPTKFSDLVDDSDYITAQDVASIVVGSADVVITETASHICITFVTTSISFTPNTTMSLWAGQKVGTLTVSGTHLKQDITLTVPANFTAQVSGGTAAQSITITQTGGEVTGVSVTITYTGADSGSYNGSITATSGYTTESVGLVYSQYQGATIIAGTIGTINAAMGSPRIGELNVSGVNLEGDITASVGSGDFAICATQNGTYGLSATISKASAEASGGATLFVKYTPSSGTSTASGTLTLTTPKDGSTTTESVSLQGAVSTLTLSTNSVSISTDQNVAATGTFTIQGSNLTNGVTLALTDANSVFSLSKNSLTKAEAEAGETITVTYNSSASGNHSGSIAVNWDGTTQTISLSGTAAQATPFDDTTGHFNKDGIYYGAISDGNGGWTNDCKVYNPAYSTSGSSYTGTKNVPAQVVAGGRTFNVTHIAEGAFYGCKTLNALTLPEGLTTIETNAMYGWTNLSTATQQSIWSVMSLTIPSTVTTIGGNFLYNCYNLGFNGVVNGVQYNGKFEWANPSNVNFQTTFGANWFSYCKEMVEVVIPDSITTLKTENNGATSAFSGCAKLAKVTFGANCASPANFLQNASAIRTIIIKNTTSVMGAGWGLHANIVSYANVYVPDSMYDDYVSHATWGQFYNEDTSLNRLHKLSDLSNN